MVASYVPVGKASFGDALGAAIAKRGQRRMRDTRPAAAWRPPHVALCGSCGDEPASSLTSFAAGDSRRPIGRVCEAKSEFWTKGRRTGASAWSRALGEQDARASEKRDLLEQLAAFSQHVMDDVTQQAEDARKRQTGAADASGKWRPGDA